MEKFCPADRIRVLHFCFAFVLSSHQGTALAYSDGGTNLTPLCYLVACPYQRFLCSHIGRTIDCCNTIVGILVQYQISNGCRSTVAAYFSRNDDGYPLWNDAEIILDPSVNLLRPCETALDITIHCSRRTNSFADLHAAEFDRYVIENSMAA